MVIKLGDTLNDAPNPNSLNYKSFKREWIALLQEKLLYRQNKTKKA